MPYQYTEISTKRVGRGTAAVAIPANRICGAGTVSASVGDPVTTLSVSGAAKMVGATSHALAAGDTGDVHTEGVVPVESDGTGAIAAGDLLTASAVADATEGRVKTAAPASGVNSFLCGKAVSAAAATAGAIVMVDLRFSAMQGQ